MAGNALLFGAVCLPFLGAAALAFLGKNLAGERENLLLGRVAQAVSAAEFLLAVCLGLFGAGDVCDLDGIAGSGLHFTMDGFRAVYLVILAFMWMTALLFSTEYMAGHGHVRRYYLFSLLTLGATAGVFLSADLMTMFLFFEVMSLTSYVWVAQEETREALRAAATYLAVAVVGGMVMLMGLFLLYHLTGTLAMGELKEACAAVEDRELMLAAGCLMLFGFGAKAGMFPLHIWLPKAHPVAPAPASALLSGVLTKAGIFGMILLSGSVLFGEETFGLTVLVLGVVTMFLGALLGVFSVNIKRTFACSSVSQIGFIMTGLGMMNITQENTLAADGAFLHMVNHSLIKLVLFLLSGVVYKNLHTLDFNEIKGFGRGKPFFLATYTAGALAIGGVPLFSGYVSKTMLHEAIVMGRHGQAESLGSLLAASEWIFLVSGGMTVAYMLKVFFVLFVEKPSGTVVRHSTKQYLSLPVKILLGIPAVLFAVFGCFPGAFFAPLAKKAEPFFYGGGAGHAGETVHYFSLENLKGALISLGIGLLLYFVFVRRFLCRREGGQTRYVNRIPAWLDLEDGLYRPVFVRLVPEFLAALCRVFDRLVTAKSFGQAIPFLLAAVCRVLDGLAGGIIRLSKTFLFAEVKPREAKGVGISDRLAYLAGSILDGIVGIANRTVWKKKPVHKSYVDIFMAGEEKTSRTVRLVTRSVSYGLLLSCIGLLATMLYLLVG